MKAQKQKISNGVSEEREILNFLIAVFKLKEMPRTGWVLREVTDPETVADHTFGVAAAAWPLGGKSNLNVKRTIKIALSHDLCEVYAGDITPFFYYPKLPRDKEKMKKMLMKWARLSKKEKENIGKAKFEKEKKALLKLVKYLDPKIKKEIFSSWLDYENGLIREGRFIRQLNRIETLVQSIKFFGTKIVKSGSNWWEWVEEVVDGRLLLEFLKVIQIKFYRRKFKVIEEKKELTGILDFLLKVNKLKNLPRRIWQLLEVKGPLETVAGHIFSVALMAWIFGRKKPELNMEKLLKMALCHEMAAVYTNDLTPYDGILTEKKEKKEVFKKWLRLSRKEKAKIHLKHYKKEKEALKKITSKLATHLKKEIIQLFDEYKILNTAEARFLNQINVISVLLQALLYWEKDKKLQIDWMWEWAFEKCEDQIILEFLDALKEKFYFIDFKK